jgi:hypothetical protein
MGTIARRELAEALAAVGDALPDMRLGQLICNLSTSARGLTARAIWDVEDDELTAAARRQVDYLRRSRGTPDGRRPDWVATETQTTATRPELLRALAGLAGLRPDMRFGQLIADLAALARGPAVESVWDVEDDELAAAAGRYAETTRARPVMTAGPPAWLTASSGTRPPPAGRPG